MNKILVLGGTYFVGKYIVKRLLEDNFDVFILNRGTKAGSFGDKVTEIHCDRENFKDVQTKLADMTFDYVIDVSGLNVNQVHISYKVLKNINIKRYIFISSSAVYVVSNYIPISEDYNKGVNDYWGDYGINKLEAEKFLLDKNKTLGFPTTILRPPYIYGEGNNIYREGFIFDRATQNRPIILPNEGSTVIHFIHIEDLYCTITSLIENKSCIGEVYNVGNTIGITFRGWIEACMEACNKSVDIIEFNYKGSGYDCRDFFPFHDYQFMLDTRKIEKYYTPKISMIEGLKREYEWYKLNESYVKKKEHYEINEEKIHCLLKNK